jgi:hypothetical protein
MIIRILTLLIFVFSGVHRTSGQPMNITSENGISSTIDLSSIESITFNNNQMVVNGVSCGASYFNIAFSSSVTFNESTTGIDSPNNHAAFSLFPNPVTHSLVISSSSAELSTVEIIGANGVLVKTFEMTDRRQEIDTQELPSGIYHVLIDGHIAKFVKL